MIPTMPTVDALRARVKAERDRLNLSISQAAHRGDTSKTTWASFESGGSLTRGMRAAVARAFEWPPDWHAHDETPPPTSIGETSDALAQILHRLDQLAGSSVAAVDRDWLLDVLERLESAEARLAKLEGSAGPAKADNTQFATAAEGAQASKRARGGRPVNRPHPPAGDD